MIEQIRQISLMNKVFNVQKNEWSRIGMAWLINFLYRSSFAIGWTIVIAMFVSQYGILSLPYLFAANGIFIILGSVFYSTFIERCNKGNLMLYSIFLGVLTLFSAYFFHDKNLIIFFILLLITEAIFLSQFKIILNGYIEGMFKPLQSERIFPLIESSETIGGILAGLLIFFLANTIEIKSFVLIWIILILFIIPCIFISEYLSKDNPISNKDECKELKNELKNKKQYSFIKGIFFIVFLQWLIFNLIEFQYTKAVYQDVSNVILEAGSGFENAFVLELGQLFILFSASALLIQLFIGSRLINSLGIIGSMLLHPLVTLLSLFGLTVSYNFATAIVVKNNFTVTTVLHTNAYHSTYYAVKEKLRAYIREFMEGIVRPAGAILGTFILIILQKFFMGNDLIFYVNVSMVIVCLILLIVTYLQQDKYTNIAIDDLLNSSDKETKLNAIEILAQKGHKSSLSVLKEVLSDKQTPAYIKNKILWAFSELQNSSVIEDIIKCFYSKDLLVRKSAVKTLLSYKFLFKKSKRYMVAEYEIIEKLKLLYKKEKDDEIRSDILDLLTKISSIATFAFLADVIKNSKSTIKADAIKALGNYYDVSVINFVKPYLKAKNSRLKISALIAMGHFKEHKKEVLKVIEELLNSKEDKKIEDALYAIGELKLKMKRKICNKYIYSTNSYIRLQASIALAKMGYQESIPVLINFLLFEKGKINEQAKYLLRNIDVRISKNIDKIIKNLLFNKNSYAA